MPQFYMIDIYNVSIIIKVKTESEKYFIDVFRKEIEIGMVTVESICKWCILHHIQYGIKFKYYKYTRNTIYKNIKYLIEYIGMKKDLKNSKKGIDNLEKSDIMLAYRNIQIKQTPMSWQISNREEITIYY